jgi:dihydropteroate synthase
MDPAASVDRALAMRAEGAALIDVGGESTRPGALPISPEEEMRRVLPVVEALVAVVDCPISVDTSEPLVMQAALAAGAVVINDMRALVRHGAARIVAEGGGAVILGHWGGNNGVPGVEPRYDDVVQEVCHDLHERAAAAQDAGVGSIWVDPGFGFHKALPHNLQLLRELQRVVALGYPVVVGFSRKSMLGALTGRGVHDRMAAGLAAAVLAVLQGACVVRTHDVAQTVDALHMVRACSVS